MINPVAPVFEWWLAFWNALPYSITAFISLYFAVLLGLSVFFALWRSKH